MGCFIIKLEDYYLEYSTIVDAPVTFGMRLDEFKQYYQSEYGRSKMDALEIRLRRADEKGTSAYESSSVGDTIDLNRAGPNESRLTQEEMYTAFCLRQPIRNGWCLHRRMKNETGRNVP